MKEMTTVTERIQEIDKGYENIEIPLIADNNYFMM
jgi:hypothetical protein